MRSSCCSIPVNGYLSEIGTGYYIPVAGEYGVDKDSDQKS